MESRARPVRIGFLVPPGNPTVEAEMIALSESMRPPQVSLHFTRMVAHGAAGSHHGQEERNRSQIAHLPENVALLAMVSPKVIVLAHTATSYTLGQEGEAELVARMQRESGIPFITAFGSVLAALAHLGVKRVALGTPYDADSTAKSKANLEAHGIEVVSVRRLDNVQNIYEETAERAHALALKVDVPQAQAVFLSGVGMPTIATLEKMERDLRKPAVSSASAMMWNALRLAGVSEPISGFGRLLAERRDASGPPDKGVASLRAGGFSMSAPIEFGKIAVMGAGAVGSYYGGMLARAGHDVALIGRAQHVDAVRRTGLHVQTNSFDGSVPVRASVQPIGARGAKLVLFCVKSPDTEHAGAALAPQLDPDAVILSLQNGVDNAERLAATLGRAVIPAVVYVAVEMAGPGHVKHNGRGELVIGRSPASARIAAAFGAAGVPVEVSDNVIGALWAKLIVNCAYNALSAITQLPYGRLVQGDGVRAVMRDVVDECLAVARAAGVDVPGDMHEATSRIAQTMPGQFSSTAQDLARGKPTEIDHLNGLVVRKGEALGVPTPANRMLVALVKVLEGRGPGGSAHA